jgi:hypothetical protein
MMLNRNMFLSPQLTYYSVWRQPKEAVPELLLYKARAWHGAFLACAAHTPAQLVNPQ